MRDRVFAPPGAAPVAGRNEHGMPSMSESGPEAADTAPGPSRPKPETVTFESGFFTKCDEAYFRLTDPPACEPVFVVTVGETHAVLPLDGVRREFAPDPDSADARVLELVEEGLQYVRMLKPGDPMPKEVLTGDASWEVEARHRELAERRLAAQMVTWLSGEERVVTDPEELAKIAGDPAAREKIDQARTEAAERLGYGRDGGDRVAQAIETLADGLAHIECLREQFVRIRSMERKLQQLRRLYGEGKSALDTVDPVTRLAVVAVKELGHDFDRIDAGASEIMAVLKDVDARLAFMRELRNSLYRRLCAWDELLGRWDATEVARSRRIEILLEDTYRFLAPRYMQIDEWELMMQIPERKAKRSTEMRW